MGFPGEVWDLDSREGWSSLGSRRRPCERDRRPASGQKAATALPGPTCLSGHLLAKLEVASVRGVGGRQVFPVWAGTSPHSLGRRPQPPWPGDEQGAAPGRGMRVCVCGKAFERQACFLGPSHQGCRGAGVSPPSRTGIKGCCGPSRVPSANNSSQQGCRVLLWAPSVFQRVRLGLSMPPHFGREK